MGGKKGCVRCRSRKHAATHAAAMLSCSSSITLLLLDVRKRGQIYFSQASAVGRSLPVVNGGFRSLAMRKTGQIECK